MQTTQQAMDAGQARREAVPALWDDESLTPDEAQEYARDELLSTADYVANWLQQHCSGEGTPQNVWALAFGMGAKTVPQLLAVAMCCDNHAAVQALHTLRGMFIADHKAEIAERAEQLMKRGQ